MMRRCPANLPKATSTRLISAFNFGQTDLSTPFTTRPAATPAAPPSTTLPVKKGVQVTTLPNGARVISEDFSGPLTTVGVYLDAGPIYDPASVPGMSFVMRWALTTSNFNNSLFQVDRNLRAYGNSLETTDIRKRYIGMRISGRCDGWRPSAEDLICGVGAPRFHESDIERFRDTWDNQVEEHRWRNPRQYCIEQVESLAFFKTPLGNPRHVRPEGNERCKAAAIAEHWSTYGNPSRVVIAGVNVAHEELVSLYCNAPFIPNGTAPHHARAEPAIDAHIKQAAMYAPGMEHHHTEDRAAAMGTVPDMDKEAIVAVGFLSTGMEGSLKEYASAMVLQQLFKSALRESTSPGVRKGTEEGEHTIRSFYSPFSTAGLIGYTCRTCPNTIEDYIKNGATAFRSLTVPSNLTGAIAAARVEMAVQYGSQRSVCDWLGTSLFDKKPVTIEMCEEALASVTQADVTSVHKLALSQRPCLYGTGEVLGLPSLRRMGL